MARLNTSKHRLSNATLQAIERGTFQAKAKRLHDGGGLYLKLYPQGGGSWLYRYMHNGVERVMGLGSLTSVGAAAARERHRELRSAARTGGDPLPEKRAEGRAEAKRVAGLTKFRDEAALVLLGIKASGKHAKTIVNAQRNIETANAALGDMAIDEIESEHVAALVVPIMQKTYDTGMRVRGQVEFIIKHAKVHGRSDRNKANPATAEVIAPAVHNIRRPKVKHHNSMPFEEVPGLMAKLAGIGSPRAQALMLTILAGLRTAEVIQARWAEFDVSEKIWSVPDEHMKMRVAHFVPLSTGMLGVLDAMRPRQRGDRLFPDRSGKRFDHMAETSMLDVLQDQLGIKEFTVHGFRSSLRNWGGKRYSDNVMERVLAHQKGGVEGAYHRDPFFEERREVMEAWSAHCLSAVPAKAWHLKVV